MSGKDGYKCETDPFGFRWGPCLVHRLCSDAKAGVVLEVSTDKECVEIRVTPSGIIRLGCMHPAHDKEARDDQ